MRIFVLTTLAFACTVGALAMGAEATNHARHADDPVQALLDRVAKTSKSEQQAWLRRLEQRAIRATRLALRPEELSQQLRKIHEQLHQKTVTWQILREVIAATERREKAVIDRLVRRYRNLVFDTFHEQFDTYNQRQQAWLDVYSEWKAAGSQFDQRDRLIDWLEAAIRSVTPGAIGPIPEKPKFEPLPALKKSESKSAEKGKPQDPAEMNPGNPKPGAEQPPAKDTPKPLADPAKPSGPGGKSQETSNQKASK